MNNLIAQQEGVNATTSGAVSIGNMMGKTMQGQVEVLQRVGITFTEAQNKVLQYGTESERAAMLAQVITDNVGNMNAELAKTDAGKQKQFENNLGDIKEQLGQVMQRYSQWITLAAQSTTAITGMANLYTSIRSVIVALGISKVALIALNATSERMKALTTALGISLRGAAVGATTLKLAIQGLMIDMGVGIAIAALCEAIGLLTSSSDKATASAKDMAEAEQQAADSVQSTYDSTLKQTYGDMMARYEQLKSRWKALRSEHENRNWKQKNRAAFDELRIKISSVGDADSVKHNIKQNHYKYQDHLLRRS